MTDNDTFDLAELLDEITDDEGRRLTVYNDSMGIPTIGVGRNLRVGITDAEADYLLSNDVARVIAELDSHLSWWRLLPPPQARVVVNLAFNMGLSGLLGFGTFLGLMRTHDYKGAAADLAGTKWFGQVGQRGPRMVARITGAPTLGG